jgi:ferredoxin-NADP reductase
MNLHKVKVLDTDFITHDVKRFRVEKPEGYHFKPGQATEVTINGMEDKLGKGPFTFTSINDQSDLEFIIKIYEDGGLTKELGKIQRGEELVIHDVWGAITYHGSGVFIAGGAGVTPFIAILRQLYKEGKINGNILILSNKTENDIILRDEFEQMLGKNFINVITRERSDKYYSQRIDENLIKKLVKNFNQYFYVCGPGKFVEDLVNTFKNLGVTDDKIVIEK